MASLSLQLFYHYFSFYDNFYNKKTTIYYNMKNENFVYNFKYSGFWWFPNNPDERFFGLLEYCAEKGIILKLTIPMNESTLSGRGEINETIYQDVINGILENGEKITLTHCYEKKTQKHDNLKQRIYFLIKEYLVEIIYLGETFSKNEDIKFEEITVIFSHLNKFIFQKNKTSPSTLSSIKIELENAKITIEEGIRFSQNNSNQISLSYYEKSEKHFCSFRIKPKTELSYDSFMERYIVPLRNYFSFFLLFDSVIPLEITGTFTVNGKFQEINIYRKIFIFSKKLNAETENTFNIMSLKEEQIINSLKLWFIKNRELHPVIDLISAVQLNPELYIEAAFLLLTQALEVYHRKALGGNYLSNEDFESFKETVLQVVPKGLSEPFVTAFKSNLNFRNEYSQRKRFKKLFEVVNTDLDLKLDKKKLEEAVNQVVDTRNYLTHYGDTPVNKKILDIYGRSNANMLFSFMLKYSLLKELKLTNTRIGRNIEHELEKSFHRFSEFL